MVHTLEGTQGAVVLAAVRALGLAGIARKRRFRTPNSLRHEPVSIGCSLLMGWPVPPVPPVLQPSAAGIALPGPVPLPIGGRCPSSGTVSFPVGSLASAPRRGARRRARRRAPPYLGVSRCAMPSPSWAAATGSAARREAPRPSRSLRAPATPATLTA